MFWWLFGCVPQPPIHLHPYFLVNEKYLGGTYMGQISFMPDMYFPSFQCSGVFQAAGNIILGCFWNVLLRCLPKLWRNSIEIFTSDAVQSN